MPFTINYDPQDRCVLGKITGPIEPNIVREFTGQVAELVTKTGCDRVLNDLREAEVQLTTTQILAIPESLTAVGMPSWVKRAIVFQGEPDDYAFFETVSLNRGQIVRVFTDYAAAREWLSLPDLPDDQQQHEHHQCAQEHGNGNRD